MIYTKSKSEREGIKRMKKHVRNKGKLITIAAETQDQKKIEELKKLWSHGIKSG